MVVRRIRRDEMNYIGGVFALAALAFVLDPEGLGNHAGKFVEAYKAATQGVAK